MGIFHSIWDKPRYDRNTTLLANKGSFGSKGKNPGFCRFKPTGRGETRVLEGTDCAGSSTEPSPPLVGALSEVARGRPSGLQLEWRFESGAVDSGYKVDC